MYLVCKWIILQLKMDSKKEEITPYAYISKIIILYVHLVFYLLYTFFQKKILLFDYGK